MPARPLVFIEYRYGLWPASEANEPVRSALRLAQSRLQRANVDRSGSRGCSGRHEASTGGEFKLTRSAPTLHVCATTKAAVEAPRYGSDTTVWCPISSCASICQRSEPQAATHTLHRPPNEACLL